MSLYRVDLKEDLDWLMNNTNLPDYIERRISPDYKNEDYSGESNKSFVKKNRDACVWFLENYELIIKVLKEYYDVSQKS